MNIFPPIQHPVIFAKYGHRKYLHITFNDRKNLWQPWRGGWKGLQWNIFLHTCLLVTPWGLKAKHWLSNILEAMLELLFVINICNLLIKQCTGSRAHCQSFRQVNITKSNRYLGRIKNICIANTCWGVLWFHCADICGFWFQRAFHCAKISLAFDL